MLECLINNSGGNKRDCSIYDVSGENPTLVASYNSVISTMSDEDLKSYLINTYEKEKTEYQIVGTPIGYSKELNKQRDAETKQITVELSNGAVLNGDETSQSRISRAVLGLPDDTTEIAWIDASGEAVMLTKPDLQEALTLAGTKQTEIFTKYAQLKAEL